MEIEINKDNFQKEVIDKSNDVLVIVDFWASWCMPCKMLGPTLSEIAIKYKDKVVVAKVNVDDNSELSDTYNISAIPAVKLFKDGKVIDEFIGVKPLDSVESWLENNM